MTKESVIVGLCNPKGPENVGSVMRAAANYQVDRVVYTGSRYTRAVERRAKSADTSRRIGKNVPLSEEVSLVDDVPEGMKIVCIELVENAVSLPEFEHPENALYIFGPEDGSLSQEIINKADAVVYIPTVGCMNLAATVNVVLYDRLAKSETDSSGNQLIRESRDTNNSLKVL